MIYMNDISTNALTIPKSPTRSNRFLKEFFDNLKIEFLKHAKVGLKNATKRIKNIEY